MDEYEGPWGRIIPKPPRAQSLVDRISEGALRRSDELSILMSGTLLAFDLGPFVGATAKPNVHATIGGVILAASIWLIIRIIRNERSHPNIVDRTSAGHALATSFTALYAAYALAWHIS